MSEYYYSSSTRYYNTALHYMVKKLKTTHYSLLVGLCYAIYPSIVGLFVSSMAIVGLFVSSMAIVGLFVSSMAIVGLFKAVFRCLFDCPGRNTVRVVIA